MGIPRLDCYIFKEIVGPFLASMGFLFSLFLAMSLLRGVEVMLGSAVRLVDFARIVGYLTPYYLLMSMPVAYLFAIMLALGRLSEDREIVALTALGVAPWRFWIAPVCLAIMLAGIGVYMGFGLSPRGLASLKLHVNELIKRKLAGDVPAGIFYDNLNDITLYAQEVSPKTRKFTNILLSDERDPEASIFVLAKEGYVDPHGGGKTLRLLFNDGEVHRSAFQGENYAVVTFEDATLNIDVGGDLLRRNRFGASKEELTPPQLKILANKAHHEKNEEESRALWIAYHKRFASPLAIIALALCGVPLALRKRQRSRAIGALASLGAFVGYYVVARIAEVAAEGGKISPFLSAHLANIVFLGIAVLLVRYSTRVEA